MKTIEEVIGMVKEWKNKKVEIEELSEGLTNKNYKVDVNGESYVVRIPGLRTDIFIDREVELHNTIAAADVGVGPKVFKYFRSDYIIIMEFLDGKVMSVKSFKNHNYIIEAVESIKKVNTEAKFKSTFIMFEIFDKYLNIINKSNIKIPKDFEKVYPIVENVKNKFIKTMPPLVSCNNDLLAENFIEQSGKMRIIDWELSGLNDPCFELGDFAIEQGFGSEEDKLIIETYFGKYCENKYARMNIYKYMADILWTLWASIQNHISNIDFDYWKYGINRFNRAMNAINSREFENWLRVV